MAPPLSSQDDNAAFLDAIIYGNKKELSVRESLGLFSGEVDKNNNPIFPRDGAGALQGEVKRIAEAYATSYHGGLEQLQIHLSEEDVFSEEALRLGHKYGAQVWGRLEDGELRSSAESQGKGIEEHDWDVSKDRTNIVFYIRCWIISHTVSHVQSKRPKAKGKGRNRDSGASKDNLNSVEYLSDTSGSSGVPYRASEPLRICPTPEPRRQGAPPLSASKTSFSAGARAEGLPGPKRGDTTTPSKRKAQGGHERTPSGKLIKPSKGAWDIPVHLREQRGDLYSIPLSPTQPQDPERSLFGKQRQREGTHETDNTYMPREATAETETVVDGEEVTPREVDSVLQSAIALANEDSMQYEYHNPVAGPSGTYRNPLRQDTVIPNDTQTQTNTAGANMDSTRDQVALHKSRLGGAMSEGITQSLISHTSDPANWQQREYRRELFKLLVSYLNGIEQFRTDAYDIEAEERMNFLLNQFWLSDTEVLQARFGDDAARMQIALESWMSMRHRLSVFRGATGYFGRPREQWTEYLRHLDNIPSAQAMLAYVDLQGFVGSEGECGYVVDTFDGDLARVFDALTRVARCNGPEAFRGVGEFNEALLEWFREGDM